MNKIIIVKPNTKEKSFMGEKYYNINDTIEFDFEGFRKYIEKQVIASRFVINLMRLFILNKINGE